MRKILRLLAALSMFLLPMLFATPAHAALEGKCTASGTLIKDGRTVNPKTTNEIDDVPLQDDIKWSGSVTPSRTPRPISGYVKIDLPAPIPDIDAGSWSRPKAVLVDNKGTYHWNLPSVAAGLKVRVYGTHNDVGTSCPGFVVVGIKGTSPLLFVALVGVVLSAFGLGVAMRGRWQHE